jgi:hypothetical protein
LMPALDRQRGIHGQTASNIDGGAIGGRIQ